MVPKFQRRVQRYGWDKAAGYYDPHWRAQLEPVQRRLIELASLREGERVIDVACGTGKVSFRAASLVGPKGRVLGTDLSEGMLQLAQKVASEQELSNVTFERMDAEDLRIADGSFDLALCSLGLMYVPDTEKAVKEMHRILRPGGRAVISVWGRRDRCGWAEIFSIVDNRVKSEVCPLFFRMGTGDMLRATFEGAGIVNVVAEHFDVLLHFASDEDACGAAFAGGPTALAYSRFLENVKNEVHAEYLASVERFREGEGYAIPGEFVIPIGQKPI
jgi:ubiquinone/menaquinone biosynthesis C-methylase UbiE